MPDYMGYPVLLKSTRRFYQSEHKSKIDSLPFIYLDPANAEDSISLREFHPGHIEFTMKSTSKKKLVIKQNDYPGWKCLLNDEEIPIAVNEDGFMFVNIEEGIQTIVFKFEKPNIKFAGLISIIILLVSSSLLLYFQVPDFKTKRRDE